MAIKQNILANYLGSAIVGLAPILALPWYLSALGPKQFGLISFVMLLQALLGLFDAGLSQALIREFAVRHGQSASERQSAGSLLYAFERIYWVFAFLLAVLTALLAKPVSSHWLNLGDLSPHLGTVAVWGAAALFLAQFPGSVYKSALVGTQAQVGLNVLSASFMLARHVGGVLIVQAWPQVAVYLMWHVAVSLIETALRGWLAWARVRAPRGQFEWDSATLRSAWRWAFGLSGAAWVGALTVQMDRVFLSRLVQVDQLGYYSIAATVAAGSLQAIYPLVQAVMPRAVQLRNDHKAVRRLILRLARAISLVVVIGALGYFALGHWLMAKWLHNPQAEAVVYPILTVLLLGTALNAFYNIGYVNWLVQDKIFRILQVNVVGLLLAVVLIPLFVTYFGTIGAAIGWLGINLTGFLMSLGWIKKRVSC